MQRLMCISEFYAHHPRRRIGDMIRDEVVPYMRSLAVLPTAMRAESLARVENEDATRFFANLARTWREHNELACEIDEFLASHARWREFEINETALGSALMLFERADRIETEKRLYTAGVKDALEKAMHEAQARYRLTADESTLLLSLTQPSYWAFRNGAHAQWLLAQRGISCLDAPEPVMSTTQLCEIFHAGCRAVLEERRSEMWLAELLNMDANALRTTVSSWKESLSIGAARRVQMGYLILERPALKAVQDLVRYDNLTELLFGVNLLGIPDLLLRRMTVNAQVRLGRIDARESVLMYSVDELVSPESMSASIHRLRR